jgi:phosphoribosyl 1,2-cyclic phosphodiesterase
MKVRFWGVRGSVASPMTNAELAVKIETALQLAVKAGLKAETEIPAFMKSLPCYVRETVGGNTACVEIQAGDKLLILDGGTGIRMLGLDMIRRDYGGKPIEAHILLTHTHWDHISGLPFFVPGFNPKNKLTIYGAFSNLEARIRNQQKFEYFPVPLPAAFHFVQLKENSVFQIGDVQIETLPLNHPGGSHSYRMTHQNKSIVYATDSEYKDLSNHSLRPFIRFFQDADMLIFDAQFTLLENIEKEDWGHSNVFCGIDMAIEAGVKKLMLIHHDPAYNDQKLYKIFQDASEYLEIYAPDRNLEICLASEGLTLTV